MKKLLLIAGLVILTIGYAAPRRVMFEEFTTFSG